MLLTAGAILRQQGVQKFLKIDEDLVMCLEAFHASFREARADRQRWITDCLVTLIKAALDAASEAERQNLSTSIEMRIQHDDAEFLYGVVDVRAWSSILDLFWLNTDVLNAELLSNRIDIQILGKGLHGHALYDALLQVASLVEELRQAEQ